jgi:serine/threonine protein kinase
MAGSMRCRTCGRQHADLDSLGGQCPRCLLDLARSAGEAAGPERHPGQGRRFGDYALLRRVGVGPLGRVHEALQVSTGRRVALKRWNTVGPASEAGPGGRHPWPASELRHPGIVTVHAHGQRDDTVWIAMDFMRDGSLARWIDTADRGAGKTDRRERNQRLAQLFGATMLALDHAHRAGAVHGGIKPENLLFTDDGHRLALSDFAPANGAALQGLSWLDEPTVEPRYLAPEQVSEPESAGPWSDIYALAACLVDALLPESVVRSEGAPVRSALDLHRAEIPASVDAALRSCLEEDPRARPTAAELGAALLEAADPPRRPASAHHGVLSRAQRFLQSWRRR